MKEDAFEKEEAEEEVKCMHAKIYIRTSNVHKQAKESIKNVTSVVYF